MDKTIYMDHGATTPMSMKAFLAMRPFMVEEFGNPSSTYKIGGVAKDAITEARKNVASLIHADPSDIFFTSGGTEADNWALIRMAEAMRNAGCGNHIITSQIEHDAVLKTCKYLESVGFTVTYLPVNKEGLVDVDELEGAITDNTILVSIMYQNNEIGTIEPIKAIGEVCNRHKIPFHTDAVQAVGHIPINVKKLHIDLLSASAHKFNGPKGVGFLYFNQGDVIGIEPYILGGHQMDGFRAGTENVAAIVGLGEAAKLSARYMRDNAKKCLELRSYLGEKLLTIPDSHINGVDIFDKSKSWLRSCNNINISFDGIDSTHLQQMLSESNVCVSVGSACRSYSPKPSHVLKAIGLSDAEAFSTLRITLGYENTKEECDKVFNYIKTYVGLLRE